MNDDKLNLDDFDFFEGKDETYEVVSIIDDDGVETDFFVVDGIETDGTRYMLVIKTDDFELDEPEAYLIKEIADEGDSYIYVPVDDDNEYQRVLVLLQENEDGDYEIKV